jgi:hypothetical protein
MNARFLSPPAAGGAAAAQQGFPGPAEEFIAQPEAVVGDACCCPARPAVRVIMPPSPSRPHATELLLCGHHYLVSKAALTAAGAVVRELPDTPADIASWVGIARQDSPEPHGATRDRH